MLRKNKIKFKEADEKLAAYNHPDNKIKNDTIVSNNIDLKELEE